MKLLALLIGLVIERLATHLFHLRELRWLDGIIDAGFRQAERFRHWPVHIPVVLLGMVLVLPVFAARHAIGDVLYGFPYLILAIVVLFFSLGPSDIGEDVDHYCKALESGDLEQVNIATRAMTEADVPRDPSMRTLEFEEAVCVQANNRLFAVIFWFVLLGPIGAWAFRVSDLIRRRAVFSTSRRGFSPDATMAGMRNDVSGAATDVHGWLAWIPARLVAIGYGLAGSFDAAKHAWKTPEESRQLPQSVISEELLARVGTAALALQQSEGESDEERAMRGAQAAKGMVYRLFVIWAAIIAAMTLYGVSV